MTIHGIDDHLEKMIRFKAEAEGLSLNKTIKKLLETALGIKPQPYTLRRIRGCWKSSTDTQDIHNIDRQLSFIGNTIMISRATVR